MDWTSNNDIFVSLNYDTLLDKSIEAKYNGIPNYGIDLYDVDNPSQIISRATTDTPLFLKPHGSLNWLFCVDCLAYYYTEIPSYNLNQDQMPSCRRHGNDDEPDLEFAIIPPKPNKQYSGDTTSQIFENLLRESGDVDEIWFLGYSLPDVDTRIIEVFNRIIANAHPSVSIVNLSCDRQRIEHFEQLLGCTVRNPIDSSFEDWVDTL